MQKREAPDSFAARGLQHAGWTKEPAARAFVSSEAGELAINRREGARDIGFARHVALDRDRAAAGRTRRLGGGFGGGAVAQIIDRDVVAARRGKLHDRGADPAAAAGHQQHLAHWWRSLIP